MQQQNPTFHDWLIDLKGNRDDPESLQNSRDNACNKDDSPSGPENH